MVSTKMITSAERAERIIKLCNLFKDRVAFYNVQDQYKYANYLWSLGYKTGECKIIYEDGGDDPYYDLVGLEVNGSYACIPVPLLTSTQVAEIFKQQPEIIEKHQHYRNVYDIDENDITWETLMPELMFLSLTQRDDDLWIMCDSYDWLPQNPVKYNDRGVKKRPIHDKEYHQWFEYKGSVFKSFSCFAGFFNKLEKS